MTKVLTTVGARPQFIKASVVSCAMAQTPGPTEVLVHTDVMQDAALLFAQAAERTQVGGVEGDGFILATLHRAENTDDPARLRFIVTALNALHAELAPVVLPLHPRTRAAIAKAGLTLNVQVIDPVGYLEMVTLLRRCALVLTDSGGVQKEAFFFGKACVTMRDQTEWVELVRVGANTLVGADAKAIITAARTNLGRVVMDVGQLYGGGVVAEKIAKHLAQAQDAN